MKVIFLMRHADASPSNGNPDISRLLSERGKKDAYKVADKLQKSQLIPEIILVSNAKRCFETSEILQEVWHEQQPKIEVHSEIYENDSDSLMEMVKMQQTNNDSVMILGHNPSVTDLANEFSKDMHPGMVPACVLVYQFDVENWNEVALHQGKFVFRVVPF